MLQLRGPHNKPFLFGVKTDVYIKGQIKIPATMANVL